MQKWILVVGMLLTCLFLNAQEARLAQQYFQNGEYEKAGQLYEKLFSESKNDYYFNRYVESLLALERFDEAEKIVSKEIRKRPKELQLLVTKGNILERQYKDEEAAAIYEEAIRELPSEQFTITKLANAFMGLTKYELAIETYEKGMKLLRNEQIFAYHLGNLYRQQGDFPKMIRYYLMSLKDNPGRLGNIQAIFQRYLPKEDMDELQMQLYDQLQEDQDALELIEMLTWVFIQKKDYRNALRQTRALDKRLNENGGRVYNLADVAFNDHDYDAAIAAYEYLINEKGPASPFYLDANRQSLRASRNKLVSGFDYTEAELRELEKKYETFLGEFGWNSATSPIILELAELEAFFLNDLEKAISVLDEMVQYPGINPKVQAEGKLRLADFFLMEGEIWEATLLYSQVDKALPDDMLGHEARYRNAKLSYYNGDFQWAQSQFEVLKASTSKLIANDALDLSVFIMDNLGLDTTAFPLDLYAKADLLVFQNRFEEAFQKLDSLVNLYPDHSLEDDVYYLRAQVYKKRKENELAVSMYEKIIEKYPDEIRADNALYELAELYEDRLNEPEKAKELYERIFIDYSNSTFAVEARKRYRLLRGDNIQ